MKIKALKKTWEIADISYKDRRQVYQLNVKAFWDGKIDPDRYYEVLDKIFDLSGLTEQDVKGLSMPEVDQLLQAILTAFLGLEKNVDGD